jgi:hypothetical protein
LIDPSQVADNVHILRERIIECGGTDVSLIAVTKTFATDAIHAAFNAGCEGVGENYAQELLTKVEEGLPAIDVHFIGGIQSNKVRQLAAHVDLWQSVDSESVIKELGKRAPGAAILLQVDTTNEASKGGIGPGLIDHFRSAAESAGLMVRGLMTIGPTDGTVADQQAAFVLLRALTDQHGLEHCSMGMSGDYETAVGCGSTMVRIGSALFGARPAR